MQFIYLTTTLNLCCILLHPFLLLSEVVQGDLGGYSVKVGLSFLGDESGQFLEVMFLISLDHSDLFELLHAVSDDLAWGSAVMSLHDSLVLDASEEVLQDTHSGVGADVELARQGG